MKLIYVAGPLRDENPDRIIDNIASAARVALAIWRMGGMCYSPHLNTARFLGMIVEEHVMAGQLAMLERCDALVLCGGWDASAGARDERAHAYTMKLPIFVWPDALEEIREFINT